jgi:hypothetical protein
MRKVITGLLLCATLGLMIAAILATNDAEAIPAFARKYRMSCTTCHAPFPRLKPYGDEFAGNGFTLKDQDAPRYFEKTGDQNLSLIRDWPLAARFEGFIKHQTASGNETDFTVPYNLKLMSGGALANHLAYYFYFFLSERGEVAGIEDAFIMFDNLLGQEFDIYVGQFQVSDPLFKRELRLEYEDYDIYTVAPGLSKIDLKYDRGLMLTYGLTTGTDFTVEVLNGNGIGGADEDFKIYDNDKYKNVLGRVSQDIGEYFRAGAFGYYGKEKRLGDGMTVPYVNEVWMAGGDGTAEYGPLTLNLQYVERRDDNPDFLAPVDVGDEIETRGGFAEVIVWPYGDRSRWYAAALYNKVDSDINSLDYESITGHVGYILHTNFRLTAENTYDIENEENRVVLGFVTAF